MVAETNGKYLKTAERRNFVLEMRKSGTTYRVIAEATIKQFGREKLPTGWDCLYAYKDVKRELMKLREAIGENAADIRQIQLERLNRLLQAVWPQAIQGHLGEIDRATKLIKQISDLMGVEAPRQFEIRRTDLTNMTEEQLEMLADGEDLVSVLAAQGPRSEMPNPPKAQIGAQPSDVRPSFERPLSSIRSAR